MTPLSQRQRYGEQRSSSRRELLKTAYNSFRIYRSNRLLSSDDDEHDDDDPTNLEEMECVRKLKEGCRLVNISMSDNLIFRFACHCNFDYDLTRATIVEKFDDPHLYLRMEGDLLRQFNSLVLFKLPGLKTRNHKHEVLYFRGCRHSPSRTSTELLIKNLCYVLNDMSVTEEQCRNGVAFILDLDRFTRENLTNESVAKFLTATENQVPTKVETVLLINVPSWFMGTWKSLFKSAISESFAKKFHFLGDSSQLVDYLMDGYEEYLPAELGYWRDSNEIVEDFIDQKLHDETERTIPGSISDLSSNMEGSQSLRILDMETMRPSRRFGDGSHLHSSGNTEGSWVSASSVRKRRQTRATLEKLNSKMSSTFGVSSTSAVGVESSSGVVAAEAAPAPSSAPSTRMLSLEEKRIEARAARERLRQRFTIARARYKRSYQCNY